MTTSAASRTTANATTEGNLRDDISPILWHIGEATAYPLHTLLGGDLYLDGKTDPQKVSGKIKKEVANSPKYSVIEKDPLSRQVTTNAAVADTTTTTVVLDSNTNIRIGDTLYNQTGGGEKMLVTAVDSGGANLTVRRNLGSTTFEISDNAILKIIGCGYAESAAKATLVSQLAAERERRTQISKRCFGVSGTLMESLLWAGEQGKGLSSGQWSEEMTQAAVNHRLDIENSWWMNPNVDTSTNAAGGTVGLSRGILAELDAYTTDELRVKCEGSLTEDFFFGELSQRIFKYGPRKKTLFADATLRSEIDKFARNKLRVENMTNDYGLNIQKVETCNGILNVISCGVFDEFLGDSKKGFGVVLDLDRVIYKYMTNRDSNYEVDVQTRGTDAKEGQYLTEAGLSLRSLPHHNIIQVYAD